MTTHGAMSSTEVAALEARWKESLERERQIPQILSIAAAYWTYNKRDLYI